MAVQNYIFLWEQQNFRSFFHQYRIVGIFKNAPDNYIFCRPAPMEYLIRKSIKQRYISNDNH